MLRIAFIEEKTTELLSSRSGFMIVEKVEEDG